MAQLTTSFDPTSFVVKLDSVMANVPKALQAAGLVLLAEAQRAIKDGGPGWTPFKTLPKRPHQLLWDTGTLIQSLAMNGPNNEFDLEGDTLTIGSTVRYASWQNDGIPGRLPARPFLFVDKDRADKAAQAFQKYLLKGGE